MTENWAASIESLRSTGLEQKSNKLCIEKGRNNKWHCISLRADIEYLTNYRREVYGLGILHAEPGPILYHSWIQLCCTAHQSHRLSLCWIVKESRSNGHPGDSSRRCKHRHTMRSDTGRVTNMPIS
ncbi:hypothetical protein TNCV_2225961 [Trichonephila clavipes]|nr:hypothetical protein TNCV_2225961 [Trichonephila clavipes]